MYELPVVETKQVPGSQGTLSMGERVGELFTVARASKLTMEHLAALINGTLAAAWIVDVLSAEQCEGLRSRIRHSMALREYDRQRVDPPISRFGPCLNDYRTSDRRLDDRYWANVEEADRLWRRVESGDDTRSVVFDVLGDAWGPNVGRAVIAGRQTYAGVVREIRFGAHVHDDELAREFPQGLFDEPVLNQLAMNVFFEAPVAGGDLRISRRRWTPADESLRRDPLAYGYLPHVVAGFPQVCVPTTAAAAVIFDPRNYHDVTPCAAGRRLSLGYFLGSTPTGRLVVWS